MPSVSKRKGSPNNQPPQPSNALHPPRSEAELMPKNVPAQALLSACRAGDAAAVSGCFLRAALDST